MTLIALGASYVCLPIYLVFVKPPEFSCSSWEENEKSDSRGLLFFYQLQSVRRVVGPVTTRCAHVLLL